MPRPILVSGIQSSGKSHIGNYLGMLKQAVELQNSGGYSCYYFIADLHSLTEYPESSREQERRILEITADALAAGLDPKRSVIFQQSQVPAHSELAWIFMTITPEGELRRMTQYKDKAIAKQLDANAGLLMYPALMAADILLYDAKFVPVGEDQLQHLELTRTIARKFNSRFGRTFSEPKAILTKTARVMSLKNPEKKMSKSQPETCLFLDDSPDAIEAKIKSAVTDSGSEVKYDIHGKPGISNLLDIYAALSGDSIEALERRFAGKNYGEFKRALITLIADHFADFRKKKAALVKKPSSLVKTLEDGSKKAALVANKKMAQVKKRLGLAV
jgi:tryptophanyl-tRNA synthetase